MYKELENVIEIKILSIESEIEIITDEYKLYKDLYYGITKNNKLKSKEFIGDILAENNDLYSLLGYFIQNNDVNEYKRLNGLERKADMLTSDDDLFEQNKEPNFDLYLNREVQEMYLYNNVKKIYEEMDQLLYSQCIIFFEEYKKYIENKDLLKQNKRRFENIKKKISKFERLNDTDTEILKEYIEILPNKIDILKSLNSYLKEVKEKEDKKREENKIKESKDKEKHIKLEPIIFDITDEEITQEENDEIKDITSNYYDSFKNLKDEQVIINNLNNISNNQNFYKILYILIDLSIEDKNKYLEELFVKYLKEFDNEQIIKEKNDNDNIYVLFAGTENGSRKILDDFNKNLADSDKSVALNLIDLIREDGALFEKDFIVKLPKVYKLKKKSVRITYKRLDSNHYVILGIFRKQNGPGNEIIDTTIHRLKNLDIKKINKLYDDVSFLNLNENIYEIIKNDRHIKI